MLPGDRVLDIGLGFGYQPCLIVRDAPLAAYRGLDYVEKHVEKTRHALEVNGLQRPEVEIDLGDLYALTRADVEAFGADLMICCEVLEHTPDPETGLCTLAAALPEGAELLFSVPLLGRLEAVWEHRTVFDSPRILRMVEAAGLYVHGVHALANTWVELLVSRNPEPSPRARQAEELDPWPPLAAPLEHRDFVRLDLETARPFNEDRTAVCSIEPHQAGVECVVLAGEPAGRKARPSSIAGVAIPVDGLPGVRLDLELVEWDDLLEVVIEGRRDRHAVARWVWDVVERPPISPRTTSVLRVGRSTARFTAPFHGRAREADSLRVLARVRPSGSAVFRVHRAAYLR